MTNTAPHAIGVGPELAQDFGDLEQRGRADVGAMGEAEEHQERLALEVLLGDRAPVLIGQAERPADGGDLRHARRRHAAGDDEHHAEADDEPGEKRGGHQENAQTAGSHVD